MNLRKLQRTWDELGRRDPLWAVLAAPDKRGGKWDPAEFFRTGADVVDGIMRHLRSLRVSVGTSRALDFGCGVGRLTQPLCGHFDRVWGVDIAPSMIELARQHNRHGNRCTYLVNEVGDLSVFESDSFDFVCSLITLQHMPAKYATGYIQEFVRVLAPEGVLVFQMTAEPIVPGVARAAGVRRFVRRHLPCPVLAAYRALRDGHAIEMYGIPREDVVALLQENGAAVLDVREDTSAGAGWTSFLYCAAKRRMASGDG